MFSYYIKLNDARDDDEWGTNDDEDHACYFDNYINLFVDYQLVFRYHHSIIL